MNATDGTAALPLYRLLLIVAGGTARSGRAIANLRRLCDEQLNGDVDLEIVDIHQQPELARTYQVVAVPTLLKLMPLPVRRIIGDLSEAARVLHGLELVALSGPGGP